MPKKSYAKEVEVTLMTNWLINSRPSGSKIVDPIAFTEKDMRDVHYPYCDALVVRAVVARNGLGRMLVDNDSSVNVMFLSTYEQMSIDVPLEPSIEASIRFHRRLCNSKRDSTPSHYNGRRASSCPRFHRILSSGQKVSLLRSPWSTSPKRTLGRNVHSPTMHEIPTEGRIATTRGNHPEARKCYRNA
ncbi:Ribonuclease H [Abeliophyllum distichum]|uniref:Ribonuclease H n=1 Tax=Abeliophyllum distichum TaxID=126358 RepID=A0ABD1QXA6_9LAMI